MTPQPLPVRATFPLRVMVGAYQWGTRAGTQYASSADTYQTFWVFRDALQKWQYENFGTLTGGTNGAVNDQATWSFTPVYPTANADSFARASGMSLKIYIADLLTNDAANFGTLSFAGASATSTNGQTLTNNGIFIYVPANSVADAFTYTVTNSMGVSATGTVTITLASAPSGQPVSVSLSGGTATASFAGIPDYPYFVERGTNIMFTAGLRTWATNAPGGGLFQIFDDFSDLNGPPSQAFYHVRYNP
jgi:hypothetical protein